MAFETSSMRSAMKEVLYKRTIKGISSGIKESKDLKAALTTTLNQVVEAAQAEAGTFWFHDKSTDGRIRPFAVYGGGDMGDFSLALGEGLAGKSILNSKSVIVEDCTSDPRWQGKADAKTGFVTKSMIVMPLCVDDVAFGCIQIINKKKDDYFDQQDLLFIEQLAEFSSTMFVKLGFVEGGTVTKEQQNKIGFMELFSKVDEVEMEIILRRIKEFSLLNVKEQQIVVSHMKEILKVFRRNKV